MDHCGGSAARGLILPTEWTYFDWGSGVHWVCLLSVSLVEMVRWCFNVVWSCVPGALALGSPRRCRPRSSTTGPLTVSYKVIFGWLLLVLVLEVLQRDWAVNQGQLMLVLALVPLSKRCVACWCWILLVWEIVGKSEAWTMMGHSHGKDTGNALSEPTSSVRWNLRGSLGWGEQYKAGWWRLRYGTFFPALWGGGWVSEKERWPLPCLLSGRKLPNPPQFALWYQTI